MRQSEDDSILGVAPVIITLMMQAERTSETSVCFNESTWRYFLEC
jgi:hypothetical protein